MKVLPFDSVFKDESAGNLKTRQLDYQTEGQYPIVDQGKSLIGGYTDDKAYLCKAELPVIIFGDHTRCLKYIDFPFGMGADGVKVLRPKIAANEKYLYYYLKSLRLPDAGYNRHFKFLKRTEILLPDEDKQDEIAELFSKIDRLIKKQSRSINLLNQMSESLAFKLFGESVNQELGDEE